MINLPGSNHTVSWGQCDLSFPKPEKPKTISFSAEIPITKEMRKEYNNFTRTQPDLKYPKRKRAWRLVRKWFNRYQKPRLIGMTMMAETIEWTNIPMTITDVKISKSNPGIMYDFITKPQ